MKSITEAQLGLLMADYLDVLQKLYEAHQAADLVYGFYEWSTRASLALAKGDYADVRRGIAKARKFLSSIKAVPKAESRMPKAGGVQ